MSRSLKAGIADALGGANPLEMSLSSFGAKAVSPLIGLLCSTDLVLRWRAIEGLGIVAATIARTDPEKARVILRRLWWMLNDESGGIGWGAPEAMAEILAKDTGSIADEFAKLLLSLIDPAGNFLELAALRKGAVWGAGRLCCSRPDLCLNAGPHIAKSLVSGDPEETGFAAWALSAFPKLPAGAGKVLSKLAGDRREILLYTGEKLLNTTISELASAALTGKAEDS